MDLGPPGSQPAAANGMKPLALPVRLVQLRRSRSFEPEAWGLIM